MFESALIESRKRKPARRRLLFVLIAVVLHLVVLVAVVFAQYWAIDAVPEPPIQVSFFQAAAPPPPPPPPPPPKPAAPQPKPVVVRPPQQVVQPVVVPEKVPEPPKEPEPASTGSADGVEGGVEGGVAGGVPGGVPGGAVGGTGNEILHVGGAVAPPVRLSGPSPTYTEVARKARIQGIVILEAIIDKDGTVTNVRVLKGLPLGLEESAVAAVKQWRYRPATLNGRPVSVYFTLTVNFRLQ